MVAIAAAISPYRAVRDEVRASQDTGRFVEVFVDCPIEVLMERDVKGLYQKALNGELQNFTGVSDPYELPENPEIVVHTDILAAYAHRDQLIVLESTTYPGIASPPSSGSSRPKGPRWPT